ncbi:MAG: M99 family carboxypeptidase catalytic domain-containing protein [Desulfovibrionales bacterium]
MKHSLFLTFFLSVLSLILPEDLFCEEFTYFSDTQYPLQVHYLKGESKGKTVLVQGGIQGDEATGFISAQILTRAKVKKGNLIIIPRANLPSVHHRTRKVNVDLNRRFDKDYNKFYEDRIARLIRLILNRCDGFIHLHEGYGFHSPEYKSSLRNPNRYGQSMIIDTDVIGDGINLKGMVTSVLGELNRTIINPDYAFELFNTDTFNPRTRHLEQRKSLTYFATKEKGIPAVAIEVSKSITDLEWKVRKQLHATSLLLKRMGVEVELPKISQKNFARYFQPSRTGLVVNGKVVQIGGKLQLDAGKEIHVQLDKDQEQFIDSKWAVFASDRPKMNLVDSPRLALYPFSHLTVFHDGVRLGRIGIEWKGEWPKPPVSRQPVFVVRVNGNLRYVPAGHTLQVLEGSRLVFEGVWQGISREVVNVKGYVSDLLHNDGQDLGMEIVLDPEVFLSGYLERNGRNWRFEVQRETPGKSRESATISVTPREVRLVRFQNRSGKRIHMNWREGTSFPLPAGEYLLEDLWGTGSVEDYMIFVNGRHVPWGGRFALGDDGEAELSLYLSTTCRPLGRMELGEYDTVQLTRP